MGWFEINLFAFGVINVVHHNDVYLNDIPLVQNECYADCVYLISTANHAPKVNALNLISTANHAPKVNAERTSFHTFKVDCDLYMY